MKHALPSCLLSLLLIGCQSSQPKPDNATQPGAQTSQQIPAQSGTAESYAPVQPQLTPEQQIEGISQSTTPGISSAAPENITWGDYTVQLGDSLWLIAKKHDTSVNKIMEANALSNNLIRAGMKLKVPMPAQPTQ